MDPEKVEELQRDSSRHSPEREHDNSRQSRDFRRSVDIENYEGRVGAIVKAQKSGHSNRRKSSEKDASERKFSNDQAPPLPTIPAAAYKESVEVPDFRFSMASEDDSSDEDRARRSIAAQLDRPTPSRPASSRTNATGRTLPELTRIETKLAQKEAHPWQHLGLTLGGPMIALFDITIPCIIYYVWYNNHRSNWWAQCQAEYPGLDQSQCPIPFKDYDKDILGYAIICFGFGELWILIARVHRLLYHPDECAPLLSRNRWELDATSWVYGVAMILALIPFVVGSSLELIHLYLYSPSFIMGFLGLLMFVTTFFPFTLPVGINSQAKGTELRPFIYYAAEDFIAVDGLQDREFRVRYNERYETNRMFRRFFVNLTLWWMLGVCTYIGAVSAVIWCLPFHYAFGLSFGVLFAYIAIWAGTSFFWVKYEMAREHRAYEEGAIEA